MSFISPRELVERSSCPFLLLASLSSDLHALPFSSRARRAIFMPFILLASLSSDLHAFNSPRELVERSCARLPEVRALLANSWLFVFHLTSCQLLTLRPPKRADPSPRRGYAGGRNVGERNERSECSEPRRRSRAVRGD